ncbi:VOC family protein [Breznakiella homolactica]|uniref:VOC family protein n=1 Tax=Breznakiella homolactica TaxID=2798577 RepID=A0A7T7XPC4_9SPIR|nr:VOC family protein [Breznakiella homolactica]QQO09922.1 VOC family protein [Breznakiella homolactica]
MKVKYVTMIVKNMEESVAFYSEVMDFKADSVYDLKSRGRITLMKGEGDAMLEIIQSDEFAVGLYSVGMEVDDVSSSLKELESKGAKITMEPQPTTDGYCAFIEDPNGVRIALVQHNK